MPTTAEVSSLRDLEDAGNAYERVRGEIEAVDTGNLSAMNVDAGGAASVALGVAPRILALRERAAQLVEFEIRCVDRLPDYAKAVWFLHVTNLPPMERGDCAQLVEEVLTLRSKLLLWAEPLAVSGKFSKEAVAKIKEGHGHKDAASDVVALVALYRSVWEEVRGMCGVTDQDLARGALVGPALFAGLSRKDEAQTAPSENAVRLRQAWTLLDRAYQQCQRAVAYLRFSEGDAEAYAPSLRKNSGVRSSKPAVPAPKADTNVPLTPEVAPAVPVLGDGGSPFVEA